MEMILTGRRIDAAKALRIGLVCAILPAGRLLETTVAMAWQISGYSGPVVLAAREAVNRADQTILHDGILFERRQFPALFATSGRAEDIAAFLEKRTARFQRK